MALPKLNTPTYKIKLHSIDHEISYRPFLVKEEKILLMAIESKNDETMLQAIRQIINNCCTDAKKIKIESIPLFDLEYWFLHLRAKSVGESVKLILPCAKCESNVPVDFNINDVALQLDDDHSPLVKLTDTVSIKMAYPNIKQFSSFTTQDTTKVTDKMFSLIRDCTESIIEGDKIFEAKLQTKTELDEFVQSLNQEQFRKVIGFFDTMPKLRHTLNYQCTKEGCDERTTYTIQGLENFFLSP